MSKAIAFAMLSCVLLGTGCGGAPGTQVFLHEHGREETPMTIDTSQVPKDWGIGSETRERDGFGISDRKRTITLRPGQRIKVIIVPEGPPGEL